MASRRINQYALETPSSFETVLTHLLRMRAWGRNLYQPDTQDEGLWAETLYEPGIQDEGLTSAALKPAYQLVRTEPLNFSSMNAFTSGVW